MRHAVLLVLSCWPVALAAQVSDVQAVQQAFRDYRTAIAVKNGDRAQQAVTSETLAQYDRMRDLALHADQAETRALSLFEKLMVLSFRLRMSASDLQSMSGAALFSRGIQEGWMSDSVAAASDIVSVRIEGERAAALLVSGTRTTGIEVIFRREQGQWRFDLMAIGPIVSSTISKILDQAGIPEDEYVLNALAEQHGERPSPEVWEPLIR